MQKKHFPLRKIVALITAALLIAGMFPAAVFAKPKAVAPFPVATVSDIHYYPECLTGTKGEALYTYLEGNSCIYDDLDAMLDAALESLKYQIENEGLKYIVLVGDLTTNGEYEGHAALAEKLRCFKEETGCEIYVTNGNHDVNNYDASTFVNNIKEQGKVTSPADFVQIWHDFGFDSSYHRYKGFGDGSQGCLTYSIKTDEGYRLILADGGKYSSDATESGEDSKETAGAFSGEQLEWILSEAEDALKNGETPLLFTHWNMSGMNYLHDHILQGFTIDNDYILQETLADAGIHFAFSGHQHATDVDITYSDSGEALYSIINPTLTQFPFAYRITTFTQNKDGGIDADFEMCAIDGHSAVKTPDGNNYPSPYRKTGFFKQYSGENGTADFLWKIAKMFIDRYIGEITEAGSVIAFLKNSFGIDLRTVFYDLLKGGITLSSSVRFNEDNLMAFAEDLDAQLTENFINNKEYTYSIIRNALNDICETGFSNVPCTKFIEKYGFGSPDRGGTLGDLVHTVLVYLYEGNEDISDDAFAQDILRQSFTVGFTEKIFTLAVEKIIDPVIVDGILAETQINTDKLFTQETADIGASIQFFLTLVVAAADNIMYAFRPDTDIFKLAENLGSGSMDMSVRHLIETVLETGLISYGKTINEVLYSVLDIFFDENNKEATAYQLGSTFESVMNDPDKDYGVTYSYNGPVAVTPSEEDMQLPTSIAITYGKDASTEFTVSWLTKYSVGGTDITFLGENDAQTETETEKTEITGFGFDFGSFGILPWTRQVIRHTVRVTGLEAGTEYRFIIGDKAKGFMSEECSVTTAKKGGEQTFIAVSGTAAITPAQSERTGAAIRAALDNAPDAAMIINAGDTVRESENADRWKYLLDENSDIFANMPMMAAAGAADGSEFIQYLKYSYPSQLDDSGVFYSFDSGNIHFISLNMNNITSSGSLTGEQLRWLKNDLNSSRATWVVLTVNSVLYGPAAEGSPVTTQLDKLIADYDIDLVIQGSGQQYSRSSLLASDGKATAEKAEKIEIGKNSYDIYDASKGFIALTPGSTVNAAAAGSSAGGYACICRADAQYLTVETVSEGKNGETFTADCFGLKKTSAAIKLGDVDLDGKITVADARLALRFAINLDDGLSDIQIYAAGVENGRTITVKDARTILRTAIKLTEISPDAVTVSFESIKKYADAIKSAR